MAKKSVKRIRYKGGLKELARRVDDAGKLVAVVGVLGPKGQAPHGGMTVAQIGALHEYGYSFTTASGTRVNVPSRSFIRIPLRNAKDRLAKALRGSAKRVVQGAQDARQALEVVGLVAQGVCQKAMAAGLEPPLAESTIASRKKPRKGHKGARVIKPLIDTGQLRSSISSEVRVKGGSS